MEPYKKTAIFDEVTLPDALHRDHSTKAGVWGVVRVIEGRLRLEYADGTAECILAPGLPGLVRPRQVHRVEPLGAMRMLVEFFEAEPELRPGS